MHLISANALGSASTKRCSSKPFQSIKCFKEAMDAVKLFTNRQTLGGCDKQAHSQ